MTTEISPSIKDAEWNIAYYERLLANGDDTPDWQIESWQRDMRIERWRQQYECWKTVLSDLQLAAIRRAERR